MKLIQEKTKRRQKRKRLSSLQNCLVSSLALREEDQILAALIEEIFKAMEQSENYQDNLNCLLEKTTKSLSLRTVFDKLKEKGFGSLKHKEKLSFVNVFDQYFCDLIHCYVLGIKWSEISKFNDQKGALVIFIDDLDRCPKDRILKVLESIKLFLDKEGCVFVIGADLDIITGALQETYPTGADKFLEKIVQVSF